MTTQKSVVLTFDDGPSKVLPEILDILRETNVPAVFFWQSRLLYPTRPWKRVLDEGHWIGTHTINHPDMERLSYQKQLKQLQNSVKHLEDITGNKVTYFRPPFGRYNDDTIKAAQQLELIPVMWKIASIDWELKNNPNQIINNVVNNLEDGSIILLHELKQTLSILPQLIDAIREKGYTFRLL
ncbi:polysaccharide deacetylase family protein [Aquibacillus halophilus]|uniref:polysaccharide deacetylase family protein n=1 Tax=Aquibacillus halophilus TaxID=930132 RepID=UPI00129A5C24|nr:polysaccharide deacetylase family protein [Aquibacillus halophilus]